MIYLDSAATSLLKPPSVARATAMAVRTMASPGRGGHSAAMRAADTVFACREAAAELFHVPEPERVVFTMNATHALNIAIHSLVSPCDPVVISGYEHNSVTRPLHALGAQVRVAESPLFDPEAAVSAFRRALPGAKAALCTMVSNVFGYLLPVREIAELCAAAGVALIVDAAQAARETPMHAADLHLGFAGLCASMERVCMLSFYNPVKPMRRRYAPARLKKGTYHGNRFARRLEENAGRRGNRRRRGGFHRRGPCEGRACR